MTSLLQTATHRTAGLDEQAPAEPMSCVDMRSYKRICDCVMGWRGFWWSRRAGRTHIARWVAMVCMEKKLLHSRTDVLAQVYLQFLR